MIYYKLKRTLPLLAALFVFLFLIAPSLPVQAASTEQIQHIYDTAGLLSTAELQKLEAMCTKYSKADDLDIIILTHNDENAIYVKQYIADFYDKMLYPNCIILCIDLAHRDVYIEAYGNTAMSHLSNERIQTISDEITPDLTAGDYDAAFKLYILDTDNYMNSVPFYFNPFIHLVVALAIGAIAVAIMAYNSGGKMTAGGSTYIDLNNSGLIGRRDDYIRTQVTRIRKPQNNGGSGGRGGGGGVSSGGHSFNGGGGKF